MPSAQPASVLTKVRSATASPFGAGPVFGPAGAPVDAPEAEPDTGGGAEAPRAVGAAMEAFEAVAVDVLVVARDEPVT